MFRNFLLLLVSLSLGLGLIEGLFRLGGYTFTGSFYVMDLHRGWSLRPRAEGWWTSEGRARIRINSDGFRDREYPLEKPAGRIRIAVLGDSFTEAFQVESDRTFVKVLEKELGSCTAPWGRTVEVMNFGIGGYGAGQELLTFRSQVRKYAPDFVVLAFFTENDVLNNHEWLNPSSPHIAPRFRLQDGRLEIVPPYLGFSKSQLFTEKLRSQARGFVNHSRILQLLMQFHTLQRLRRGGVDSPRAVAELGADYADWIVYLAPANPAMKDAWLVTEALVHQLDQEVRKTGAGFRLVTLTNPMQVHPDSAARAAFQRKIGADSLFYPDRRMGDFANREGIRITALAERMQLMASTEKVWFHGFPNTGNGLGHWNELGHRVGASLIAKDLCADLQPGSR